MRPSPQCLRRLFQVTLTALFLFLPQAGMGQSPKLADRSSRTNVIGMNFIALPAASFVMGSPAVETPCKACRGEGRFMALVRDVSQEKRCGECNGRGSVPCSSMHGAPHESVCYTCPVCGGTRRVTCWTCKGYGRIEAPLVQQARPCTACSGRGRIAQPSPWEEGAPAHSVSFRSVVYMQTTEVTQVQWVRVMGTHPWREASVKGAEGDELPATWVSWRDAQAFLVQLERLAPGAKYRLPNEAEWEFACRAGSQTPWSFGESEVAPGPFAWYRANSPEGFPKAVATRKPNAWGLFDMHGNVSEWCQDWLDPHYPSGAQVDPSGPASGTHRVCRGGSFLSDAAGIRSTHREGLEPDHKGPAIGFRVIMIPAGE